MEYLTVEDILNTDSMKISNGETVSGKEYLDGAISAFGLNPCDYYTAYWLLVRIANGRKSEPILHEIKSFWEYMESKHK